MKALIIGIDRGIGKALGADLLSKGHQIAGTTRIRANVQGDIFYLDLNQPPPEFGILPKADIAYFCAAMTTYKECRENPDMAGRVNAKSPSTIAKHLVESGTRVVLLSTSAVLDCSSPRMTVDRPRQAASIYGRTKAQAELAFLALGPMASVLRLTKVLTSEDERFSKWISNLRAGVSFDCPDDFRISPITLQNVLQALIAIADQQEGGIFQVSAASDISHAEAAWHVASRLHVSRQLIRGFPSASLGIAPDVVTAYTSLNVERLSAISRFVAPDPREVIDVVMAPAFAMSPSSAGAPATPALRGSKEGSGTAPKRRSEL